MKIAIGNDHAAVELKKTIMAAITRSMVRRWLMQWHQASLTAEY